ncbi:MAG: hypothetical protein HZB36_02535 [Candidatus Omnitrophica bacterium]|nr:hypothetical protein [Candidatus Omnitrophota bacterium]
MGILRAGDIILVDSDKSYAKIVKFLQKSPTVWHWFVGKIYELISKKKAPKWLIDDVDFYHVAMALDEKRIIEQQSKVIISPASRLQGKRIRVWRNMGLSEIDMLTLISRSHQDLGKGYDVLLIFGKTLTWFTGLGFLAMIFQWPGVEICATIVAKWHWFIDHFGRMSPETVTGDDIDDWCASHAPYSKIEVRDEDLTA